jgi:hypothetical protein
VDTLRRDVPTSAAEVGTSGRNADTLRCDVPASAAEVGTFAGKAGISRCRLATFAAEVSTLAGEADTRRIGALARRLLVSRGMRNFLSILAIFGLAACTGTTGGAGGGTTSGTTTTVSVPCTDCLSQAVTWGYTGGYVQYDDSASLSACRTYQHTRTLVGGPDAGSSQSCSGEIGGCDAGADAVHDVEQALAQPDVVAALASSVPLYGNDPRPCDGGVMVIKVGTQTLTVGEDCGPTALCQINSGHSCVPVPAGVRALVNVLSAVDQALIKQGECATTFP